MDTSLRKFLQNFHAQLTPCLSLHSPGFKRFLVPLSRTNLSMGHQETFGDVRDYFSLRIVIIRVNPPPQKMEGLKRRPKTEASRLLQQNHPRNTLLYSVSDLQCMQILNQGSLL